VLLAGGAGLLAVWSVGAGDPSGTPRLPDLRSLRIGRRRDTAASGAPRRADPVPPAVLAEPPLAAAAAAAGPPIEEPAAASRTFAPLEVVGAPAAGPPRASASQPGPGPGGPVRRRHRGDVPAAFTAVEGAYRDVAVAPPWRKVLSLVLLLAVLALSGLALAAIAGAALGVAAELVDGAIG